MNTNAPINHQKIVKNKETSITKNGHIKLTENPYHSQIGQDQFLDEFVFKKKRKGFFVEIGAVDGIHYSNTLFFEKNREWSGICIEPNPVEFEKLLNSGRNCIMENVAISAKEGTFPFLSINGYGKGLSGLVEAYDPRHIERIKRETADQEPTLNIIQVKTTPLKKIFSKYRINVVDYCSIDCEGAELDILASIDFNSVHIRCLTIENNYGLERETNFLKQLGFVLYKKIRWDDVFVHRDDMPYVPTTRLTTQHHENNPSQEYHNEQTFRECSFVTQHEATQMLNPHFVKILPMEANIKSVRRPALDYLTHRRFDLPAKYIYAWTRIRRLDLEWAKNLYEEHIGVFNGFFECDGSGKQGKEAFTSAFDHITDSITKEGFDPKMSVVPTTRDGHLIDGSHRIAASIALGQLVTTFEFNHTGWNYDSVYFLQKGLSRASADACIHACCKLKENQRLAILFPSAVGEEDRTEKILKRHGKIWYKKHVTLRGLGQTLFITQVYAGENWLGSWNQGFTGARSKAEKCFSRPGPLRAYVFEPNSNRDASLAKEQIRAIYGIDKHSVHINDTHKETIRLAGVLFNANSIDFLNHSRFIPFPKFQDLLERYRDSLENQHGIDNDEFCITGSTVLAAYGLRDCADIDFISIDDDPRVQEKPLISWHGTEAGYYPTTFENILYNPAEHFYFNGMKFATLAVVKEMKLRRGEEKDIMDVKLIKSLAPRLSWPGRKSTFLLPENISSTGPAFTVIMANYNNGAYIDQAIHSVLNQTFANWELVIIDDSSTDDSLKTITKYLNDKRITLICNESNQGYVPALRTGIANSKAPYFGILDADDALLPNAVEVMLDQHRTNQNAGYIYSQFIYCDENLIPQTTGYCNNVPAGKTNIEADCVSHFKTFKRSIYDKTSGFDSDIMFAEDKDISYKMEEAGELLYVNQDLYLYRVRQQSESHHSKKRKISILTMKKAQYSAIKRRAQDCLKKNTSFKHILKGFEYFKNENFDLAQHELKLFYENFKLDQLPKIDSRLTHNNDVAVVVVTYGTKKQVVDCVKSLLNQTSNTHEVIIINNGDNDDVMTELFSMPVLYVHSPINFFPSLGRNIGAAMTNARLVCFIDDDSIVDKNYIKSVNNIFNKYNIIGMRGRILPKNQDKLMHCPEFYDPGLIITPSSLPIEGNTAFIRDAYNQLGGMDPLLFGGEGLDLSYRISQKYGPYAIAYSPDSLIYHDPSDTKKSKIKAERYKIMHKYLNLKNKNIWKFYQEYEMIDSANRYLSKLQHSLHSI